LKGSRFHETHSRTASTAPTRPARRRHHRHGRPGPAGGGLQRRQPIIGRFRRRIECGRVIELPVSGRLLGLHALPRGAELPRPRQQRTAPEDQRAGGSLEQQTEQCISTSNCPQALVQQILTAERKFAQCMRSHGVPKYPDPTIDSEGRPIFVFSISKDGFDPHEPQIMTKEDECQRVAPAPEPRQVNP
jgi:hypothetical protein